jgi:hypothetical protein
MSDEPSGATDSQILGELILREMDEILRCEIPELPELLFVARRNDMFYAVLSDGSVHQLRPIAQSEI